MSKWKNVMSRFLNIGFLIAMVLLMVSMVKMLLIGLDIDESYAVAQSYRLAIGDHLLMDMWEPHQFSAYLSAILIKLFLWQTGSVEYLVISLRSAGIVIHVLLGVWLLAALRKTDTTLAGRSIILVLLEIMFLPKWIQMPEFELMHYWSLVLIAICMIYYFTRKGNCFFPFLAGVSLVGAMLCYPTMILLYPAYVAGWIVLEHFLKKNTGVATLISAGLFTLGSLISGCIFLAYLLSYQSVEELRQNLSYIFMDKSHTTYTMAQKWSIYAGQVKDQLKVYPKYVGAALGFTAIILIVLIIIKRLVRAKKSNMTVVEKVELFAVITFLGAGVLMQVKSIYGMLFADKNQFYFQIRYVALILPALYLGIRYHKKNALWFYSMLLPAFLSLPAVLLITNMDTNTTYAKMFIGVLGSLLIYHTYMEQVLKENWSRTLSGIVLLAAVVALMLGMIICRLVLVRVTGCFPVTVKAQTEEMKYGAEKKIRVLRETGMIWNENYEELASIIRPTDRLLYVGAENLIYLQAGCEIASPSTQGTNVYNEMFLSYYELHPEKMPTVIVIDKTFDTNPGYGNYFGSEILMDWIGQKYADAIRKETRYMTILFYE